MSNDVKAERPMFVLLVAGLGFFVLSFVAMGVFPWLTIDRIQAPDSMQNPYKDEAGQPTAVARGRDVYIAEGCWHCHSQFVRPVANEEFRYGPRSQAWESMFDIPHLYGTRRIGPDLSREAGRRSDDWHLAHLWNPRATVPGSLMPKYTWLFEQKEGKWQPTEKATDLVAYLQYLGIHFKDDVRKQVWPSRVTVSGSPTPTPLSQQRGSDLFQHYCSGCHGESGNGQGLAMDFLKPSASDLTTRYLPREEVFRILFMGSEGSAMPSFAELTEKDLWAISQYVHGMGRSARKPALETATVAQRRDRGAELYRKNCQTCHGENGIVPPAMENLKPAPKHFRDRLYEPGYLAEVIRKGRPGSAMAGYSQFSDAELQDLVAYISSLFDQKLYPED
ncbi:MAG: cbb3-type cytochrome c oxidase subunit II [Planctomycetes bacterium]|nr:cbb3-type cytochrome c oxidase subunit II [Planctomycetota bacterium]